MSRKAELPLDSAAVKAADDQFYANHPELIQDGKRVPLDPHDPAQASLRSEWMDLYEANKKKPAAVPPARKKPADVSAGCPGELVIQVVDQDGKPVSGATVKADGLTKTSDSGGFANFGKVPPKEYDISATKRDFGRIEKYPDTVNVPSQATTMATLGLRPCL